MGCVVSLEDENENVSDADTRTALRTRPTCTELTPHRSVTPQNHQQERSPQIVVTPSLAPTSLVANVRPSGGMMRHPIPSPLYLVASKRAAHGLPMRVRGAAKFGINFDETVRGSIPIPIPIPISIPIANPNRSSLDFLGAPMPPHNVVTAWLASAPMQLEEVDTSDKIVSIGSRNSTFGPVRCEEAHVQQMSPSLSFTQSPSRAGVSRNVSITPDSMYESARFEAVMCDELRAQCRVAMLQMDRPHDEPASKPIEKMKLKTDFTEPKDRVDDNYGNLDQSVFKEQLRMATSPRLLTLVRPCGAPQAQRGKTKIRLNPSGKPDTR